MVDVAVPQLGESVSEGTITKWLVREGDIERETLEDTAFEAEPEVEPVGA